LNLSRLLGLLDLLWHDLWLPWVVGSLWDLLGLLILLVLFRLLIGSVATVLLQLLLLSFLASRSLC